MLIVIIAASLIALGFIALIGLALYVVSQDKKAAEVDTTDEGMDALYDYKAGRTLTTRQRQLLQLS